MAARKMLVITVAPAAREELSDRAHRAGCSVSALAALCIGYGLARVSDEKLAGWAKTGAPRRGRPRKG